MMQKEKTVVLIKWGIVLILGLSLVLFFCPYIQLGGENFSLINLLKYISDNQAVIRGDAMFEVIFGFIIPATLTFLSAIIMMFRASIPKCVICVILNLLATVVYYQFFSATFLDISAKTVSFGLIGNVVITHLGVVLPIVNIILVKKFNRNAQSKE